MGRNDNDWSDIQYMMDTYDVDNKWNLQIEHAKAYYELCDKLAEEYHLKELRRQAKGKKHSSTEWKKYIDTKESIEIAAAERAAKYRDQLYKTGSLQVKEQILKNEADILKKQLEFVQKFIDSKLAADHTLSEDEQRQLQSAYERKQAYEDKLHKTQITHLNIVKSENYKQINAVKEQFKNLKYDTAGSLVELIHSLGRVDIKSLNADIKKSVAEHKKILAEKEAAYEEKKAAGEDVSNLKEEINSLRKDSLKQELSQIITGAISKAQDDYANAFKEAESILTSYKGHIDARLQGSDKNYDDIMNMISSNVSMSPFVKTQAVIENMRKAVDQGVAYNVEQRAFLNTISDKIANTFDAFDSNLTRLVRLQQADSTAARLGMEASLTKFFNNMFQDTSYLQDMSDSVSAAIIDANSQLNKEASAEFEYIVQKWLGSLASVGMSQSTVTNIATGLNYLSTGDVTNLSNNSQLQTLFAMSASKAGLNYSDLLLNGMNADNTNQLLASMVEYLKEIAENSDSQVVRSAYGDIFNMSLSDMRAISNLSSGDIANISGSTMTYNQMNSELNSQMSQVVQRTSLSEMMSNLYNNALFGVAEDMVSNPATWAMTKMLDYMNAQQLDMAIPFVNAGGFGVDLNTSVQDIMKLGVGLSQAFSLVGNILGGLGSSGGLNLDAWGATETTRRGSGMSFTTASTLGATSGSTFVSNNSSSDMKHSALSTATDDAEESAKITNKNVQTEHTFDEFYNETIGESAGSFINSQDILLQQVYNNDVNYLSTRDTRMQFLETDLLTHDTLMNEQFAFLFGTMPLTEKGILNVYDSNLGWLLAPTIIEGTAIRVHDDSTSLLADKIITSLSTINVRPEGTALAVHIASASDTAKLMNNTVSLAAGSKVEIDKATLVKAFKEAMGYGEREQAKSIGDLIDGLTDGSIVVKIGNEPGRRIQVDTEATGTSGYTSTINW